MTASLDDEVVDLRRANAELQRRLDEAIAERDESLRRETATAEVLQVINSSPGELEPVFDAMLEKATRLCDAGFGILWTYDDNSFRASALRNVPAPYAEFLARAPYRPDPQSSHGRIINGERVIQIVDVADTELYRSGDPLRRAWSISAGRAVGLQYHSATRRRCWASSSSIARKFAHSPTSRSRSSKILRRRR
jgi:hypothetical protein